MKNGGQERAAVRSGHGTPCRAGRSRRDPAEHALAAGLREPNQPSASLPAAALLFCFIALSPLTSGAQAGDAMPAPAVIPTAMLTAPRPADLLAMRSLPLLRAMGLMDADFSGDIPLLGVRAPSLCSALEALAASGAVNMWLCIMPDRSSLAGQAMCIGWTLPPDVFPEGGDARAAWLEEHGFFAGKRQPLLAVGSLEDGAARIALAPDEATLRAATGASSSTAAWQKDIDRFLLQTGALNLWLNVKTASALVTLFAGDDPRRVMSGFGLTVPESLRLSIHANGDDIGFAVDAGGFIPEHADLPALPDAEPPVPASGFSVDIECSSQLLAGRLPGVPGRKRLERDPPAFLPERVGVAWNLAAGSGGLAATGFLPPGHMSRGRLEHSRAFLQALSGSPFPSVKAGNPAGPEDGGNAFRAEHTIQYDAGVELFVVADGSDDEGFAIAVGTGRDAVETALRVRSREAADESDGYSLRWRLNLSDQERQEAGRHLARLLRPAGVLADAAAVAAAIPSGETGGLAMDGVMHSPRGLALIAAPLIRARLIEAAAAFRPTREDLAVERLRYLLEVLYQMRFRNLAAGDSPHPLATDLSAFLPGSPGTDADLQEWVEGGFPSFPGVRGAPVLTIGDLAAGRRMDGWAFSVTANAGEWLLMAEREDGRAVGIDAAGALWRREGPRAVWRLESENREKFQ